MAQVLHSIDGHVATIVLANEAKYNAMTLGMWVELGALLGRLREDESVRVVVLRGQGEKAFVSGADISEFEKQRSGAEAIAAALFGPETAGLTALPDRVIQRLR